MWSHTSTTCVFLKCVCLCVCRCAAAYVLLAEEEATTITEAERLFRKALTIGACVLLSSTSAFIPAWLVLSQVTRSHFEANAVFRTQGQGFWLTHIKLLWGHLFVFLKVQEPVEATSSRKKRCYSCFLSGIWYRYIEVFIGLSDGFVLKAPPVMNSALRSC